AGAGADIGRAHARLESEDLDEQWNVMLGLRDFGRRRRALRIQRRREQQRGQGGGCNCPSHRPPQIHVFHATLAFGTAADYHRRPLLDRPLVSHSSSTCESCVRPSDHEGRSLVNVPWNWWERFFEGVAVEMWLQALPPEHTMREADSLERLLGVSPGAPILDVPCGGGRLSRVFAERGYPVTAVDSSDGVLSDARSGDASRQVTWERRDMRDLPWHGGFDGAFCVGNSFGYLDDEGNAAFLRAVRATLKPGARFVLDTPMVLEN